MDVEEMKKMKEKVKRIALCIPMRGHIGSNFLINFIKIFVVFMKMPGVLPIPIFSDIMPIDKARNDIVRSAAIAKADYYFWIDADTYPSEEGVRGMFNYLTDNEDVKIVSGIYFEKAPPYNPVLRKLDEMDMMRVITKIPSNPFTVDGIGFGCVMMKRRPMDDMINKFKGNVFQFNDKSSEDLFWSREVKKLGYELQVYPDCTCAHEGIPVTEWHFLHYKLDQFNDVKELSEYLGKPRHEVLDACLDGAFVMMKEWNKKKPKTEEEITDFYKETDIYLYDLTSWWIRNKQGRAKAFKSVNLKTDMNFLDYGCGIGDYGLEVLEASKSTTVDFFDISKPSMKYLKWRLGRRANITPNRWRLLNVAAPTHKRYDVIFCFDVLEHLPNPAEHLKYMHDRLRPNGKLIATVAPKKTTQPQHISEIDITEHGFVQLSDVLYMRDDSPTVMELGLVVVKTEKPGDD